MIDAAERFRDYPMFQSLAAFTLASVGRHVDAGAALDAIARDGFAVLPGISAGSTAWSWPWTRPHSSAIATGPSRPSACSSPMPDVSRSRPGRSTRAQSTGRWGSPPRWTDDSTRRSCASRRPPSSRATRACPSGNGARRWSGCSAAAARRPGDRALALDLASSAATWARTMGCPVIEAHAPGLLEIPGRPGRAHAPAAVAGTNRATLFRREGDVWAGGPIRSSGSGTPRGCSTSPRCWRSPDGSSMRSTSPAAGRRTPRRGRAGAGLRIGRCRRAPRRRGKGRLPGADRRAACLIDRAAPGDMDGTVERAHAELEAITASSPPPMASVVAHDRRRLPPSGRARASARR